MFFFLAVAIRYEWNVMRVIYGMSTAAGLFGKPLPFHSQSNVITLTWLSGPQDRSRQEYPSPRSLYPGARGRRERGLTGADFNRIYTLL